MSTHSQHGPPVSQARRAWRLLLIVTWCLCLWGAGTACSELNNPPQEPVVMGSNSPEETVAGFFSDLNEALSDPDITLPEVRRTFVEQLASYFAPSERVDQRTVFSHMLRGFAESQATLEPNEQWIMEITFEEIVLDEQDEHRATVRLVDAFLTLRLVQHHENNYEEVVQEQKQPLNDILQRTSATLTQTETLADESWKFTVLRVNGRWFLTESSL